MELLEFPSISIVDLTDSKSMGDTGSIIGMCKDKKDKNKSLMTFSRVLKELGSPCQRHAINDGESILTQIL